MSISGSDAPRRLGPLAAMTTAAVLACAYLFRAFGPGEVSAMQNTPAPAFRLPSLEESSASVSEADLKHGRVVVNVFGSWCGYCALEHPLWLRLRQAMPGAALIGVAWNDTPEDAQTWLARQGGNPYTRTALDINGDFAVNYGVTGAPETFLIRDGIIVSHITGSVSEEEMRGEIMPFLAGGPDTP